MKVLAIARTNLRRFARDRTTVFFTLALPFIIILVIGTATERFDPSTLTVGVSAPGTGFAAELGDALDDTDRLIVRHFEDVDALKAAVRRGVVAAGVAIPGDYDERLRSGRDAEVAFVSDPGAGFPAPVQALVSEVVAEQAKLVQAASFASERSDASFDEALEEARGLAESDVDVGVSTETIGEGRNVFFGTGFSYQAPANLILFVFITSLAGAAQVISSRQLGVTRRMLATPTTARTILAGEAVSRFAIALFQGLFILVVGSLVFGVGWGDPVGAAALVGVFVLVATGAAMLFGTVFRTPEQASAVGVPVGIGLGMLGGCMWPLEIVPDAMKTFGHLFPHAWAMDAWIDLTAFERGISGIATELAVLAGFAALLLGVSSRRLYRSIVRA